MHEQFWEAAIKLKTDRTIELLCKTNKQKRERERERESGRA